MRDDATLKRLLDNLQTAQAELCAFLLGGDDREDLVTLKQAAIEFRKSDDTVRRWATDEDLGEKIDGRWYLRRSLVRKYKAA